MNGTPLLDFESDEQSCAIYAAIIQFNWTKFGVKLVSFDNSPNSIIPQLFLEFMYDEVRQSSANRLNRFIIHINAKTSDGMSKP